jgi:hypothetical protein
MLRCLCLILAFSLLPAGLDAKWRHAEQYKAQKYRPPKFKGSRKSKRKFEEWARKNNPHGAKPTSAPADPMTQK